MRANHERRLKLLEAKARIVPPLRASADERLSWPSGRDQWTQFDRKATVMTVFDFVGERILDEGWRILQGMNQAPVSHYSVLCIRPQEMERLVNAAAELGKPIFFVPCRRAEEYPGFDALSFEAQRLLRDLLDVWGHRGGPHRFLRIVRALVDWDSQYVMPMWKLSQTLRRARIRRRLPGLLKRFERDGMPRVDGWSGKPIPEWPEMHHIDADLYNYLCERFRAWAASKGLDPWTGRPIPAKVSA